MSATPRFLQLADVAEVLNISGAQVYALVRRRELKAIKIGGRGQWRVEASELEAYIQRAYADAEQFVRDHPFVEGAPPHATDRPPRRHHAHRRPCRAATAAFGTACTCRVALADVELEEVAADAADAPLHLLVVAEVHQARSLAVARRRSTARSVSRSTTDQVSSLCALPESPLTVTTPSWRTTHSVEPSTSRNQSSPSRASRPRRRGRRAAGPAGPDRSRRAAARRG